MYFITIN